MGRKPKLDVTGQIEHMKVKGIQFNIDDEVFASNYLLNHTYYFKLKAYEKLYPTSPKGENANKYINLEFAYLRDLSTIDSLIRKQILSMAIDIEHYLKVSLLRDFNLSPEDGYDIIQTLINNDPQHYKDEIQNKGNGKVCSGLVQKYKDEFAIWNFVEIISFKDFCDLYALFYQRNAKQFCKQKDTSKFKGEYFYLINPVRHLRNAAAHNNCLLIDLCKKPDLSFNFEYRVASFLGDNGIKNTSLNKQLSKQFIHDFCVLLYLYFQVAPKSVQQGTFKKLKKLFENRFVKNKEYYVNNSLIVSAYDFTLKVINLFYEMSLIDS